MKITIDIVSFPIKAMVNYHGYTMLCFIIILEGICLSTPGVGPEGPDFIWFWRFWLMKWQIFWLCFYLRSNAVDTLKQSSNNRTPIITPLFLGTRESTYSTGNNHVEALLCDPLLRSILKSCFCGQRHFCFRLVRTGIGFFSNASYSV